MNVLLILDSTPVLFNSYIETKLVNDNRRFNKKRTNEKKRFKLRKRFY
ncbi:hypothetical protein VCRA2122O12_220081 [Vibrio crassostreae]|nr:hypothetical protein VCRA2110O4_230011 [Vibrio crassostreae]CAK1952000.1 hypothetical protein VCRA2110O1_290065 [Vibrio crassostreae]CAK2725210.1 hypothetical protein VCRA2110O3_270011 [Vibrio crassostreae]CAK2752436.1 hypothetical protein VCRA2127O15_170065 [Vibrio crassostreae]CAK2812084.1 hypothetical protein VCRA2122O10_290011 [Vibrio crassostreae]